MPHISIAPLEFVGTMSSQENDARGAWVRQIDRMDSGDDENDVPFVAPARLDWKKRVGIGVGIVLGVVLLIVIVAAAVSATRGEEVNVVPMGDLEGRAQRILKTTGIVDTHNDLPWELRSLANGSVDLTQDLTSSTKLNTDFVRAKIGGLRGQFWSIWTPCTQNDHPTAMALEQIDLVKRFVARYSAETTLVTSYDQALAANAQGSFVYLFL